MQETQETVNSTELYLRMKHCYTAILWTELQLKHMVELTVDWLIYTIPISLVCDKCSRIVLRQSVLVNPNSVGYWSFLFPVFLQVSFPFHKTNASCMSLMSVFLLWSEVLGWWQIKLHRWESLDQRKFKLEHVEFIVLVRHETLLMFVSSSFLLLFCRALFSVLT